MNPNRTASGLPRRDPSLGRFKRLALQDELDLPAAVAQGFDPLSLVLTVAAILDAEDRREGSSEPV